jgi:hypothetical protein
MAAGIRVAEFDMNFADPLIVDGLRDEKELMVGITGVFGVDVSRHFTLLLGGGLSRILLNVPVTTTSVSLGVQGRVTTPEWLRRILE